MALLLGTEYCKVDNNGRFKLPIALKRQMQTEDNRFVIRKSIDAPCVELWTYASFLNEVERLQERLNPYRIEDKRLLRQLTRANIVELDTNDRLLIPSEQKGCLGEAKEIVLQSTGEYIEIWERSAYNKLDAEYDDVALLVDKRLGGKDELPPASTAE